MPDQPAPRTDRPPKDVNDLLTNLDNEGAAQRHVATLRSVIQRSGLTDRINEAVTKKDLQRFELEQTGSDREGGYQASSQTIRISRLNLNDQKAGQAAFVLGHEVQHAFNRAEMDQAEQDFRREVRDAAERGEHDHTQAISTIVDAHTRDEATAMLAGWNTLVDHERAINSSATLEDIAKASEASPHFVEDHHGLAPRSELNFDSALKLDLNDERNVQALARSYVHNDAPDAAPGAHSTSHNQEYFRAYYAREAARIDGEVNSPTAQTSQTVQISNAQPPSAAAKQEPGTDQAGRIGRTGAARPPTVGKPGIEGAGR